MSVDDGSDTAVGGWRTLIGSRRRIARIVPLEEPEVDHTHTACERMLHNSENRLLRAQARIEGTLALLAHRHNWAGTTQDELLSAVKSELFELHLIVTGKAK